MKFLASAFLSISFVLAPIAATAKSSPPYKGRVAGSSADGGGLANSKQRSDLAPSKKSWDRADKMLKKMSVDEKIGQLVHVGINARYANQDSWFFKDLRRHIVDNKLGGIVFFGAPIYETTHIANRMQEAAKIPLLMSLDAETGIGMRFADATNFPWAMAVAATGEPELSRRMGVVTGREARAIGIQHIFAPVLDINNNAANPVINVRSFSEDPNEVADHGIAFTIGLQSQKSSGPASIFRPRRHQCRFAPRFADHRPAA